MVIVAGSAPDLRERLAQPCLLDRLRNDLPGLALESRVRRAELEDALGRDFADELIAGDAPTEEEALSPDLRGALAELRQADARARDLRATGVVVTVEDVLKAVRRDVEWLMNSVRFECTYLLSEDEREREPNIDLSAYPEVRSSVINFGILPLTGMLRESLEVGELERTIHEALLWFEPRLKPDTLKVSARRKSRQTDVSVAFEVVITGALALAPAPEHLRFVTEFNFSTGKARTRLDQR